MTRKLTIAVVAVFLGSLGVVVGLIVLSKDIREKPGSFLRQYPPHPVIEGKKVKLVDDDYYFAGVTNQYIYLASTLKPLELLRVNTGMTDTSLIQLKIPALKGRRYVRITVAVDSPYFYVMDGAIPYIYRGKLNDRLATPFLKNSVYFNDALPIAPGSFAINALSTKTQEDALGKLVINPIVSVKLNYELLKRQFDGSFDVDGSLSLNKYLNKLIYVYYYRNEFIVIDTNMNLEYRSNTIDTFRIAQVKTAKVASENEIRLSAPPIITNKSHATYRNWLFVHSLLPAKNEYMKTFAKSSTIDVYDLRRQYYEFSFPIPDDDGKKVREFRFTSGKLYVLFQNSIIQYDLVKKYFSDKT